MERKPYPYLCGGTFLVLLSKAKKEYVNATYAEVRSFKETDSLADYQLCTALIRIFNAKYNAPAKTILAPICSKYIHCQSNGSVHLSFTDPKSTQRNFEIDKKDYIILLKKMQELTKKFIDVDNKTSCIDLAKALFELIEEDSTIDNEQKFYALEDGQPISKSDLVKLDNICLPSLLLGIWHFIVSHSERENKNGQDTYEKWHGKADKHAKRKFNREFGENSNYPENVSLEINDTPNVLAEPSNVAGASDETSVLPTNSLKSSNNSESASIPQDKIPIEEITEILESTTKPIVYKPSHPTPSLEINNPRKPDKDNTVVDEVFLFRLILENKIRVEYNKVNEAGEVVGVLVKVVDEVADEIDEVVDEVMAENIRATILDTFTREIRNYKIVNFLILEELDTPIDLDFFVQKIRDVCIPYIKYIVIFFKTNNNPREKIFFQTLFRFIISLYSFYYGIIFIRQSFRNITVLSSIREEELSEFEKNALCNYKEAVKLFKEIYADNNLSYEDIMQREIDQMFGYYYPPNIDSKNLKLKSPYMGFSSDDF